VKFTLKDYQEQAVDDILYNLKRARENFKKPDRREISSFSLTATTGAGKTVMAAAAIEALFWGNDAFNFEPDPGAVVLWFSDDPSLNNKRSTGFGKPLRSSPIRISCILNRLSPNRVSIPAKHTSAWEPRRTLRSSCVSRGSRFCRRTTSGRGFLSTSPTSGCATNSP
jgi:hypothetical protein